MSNIAGADHSSNDATNADPASHENEHVHKVYQEIAHHFSSTRYKPWPLVEKFLNGQPNGSVGVDLGCGNGKYLNVNKNVFLVGSDYSSELVGLATANQAEKSATCDTMTADMLNLPLPHDRFDFAISIAVVHHFSTPERRIQAVKEALQVLKPESGRNAFIYVWALEQKSSRRGWDETSSQDVMVPWVTQTKKKGGSSDLEAGTSPIEQVTKHRYYHLYKQGELENDVVQAGGRVVESGYERDNWWAIITRN